MDKIILVGFGGHAKSVADTIERTKQYEIVGYTDVKPYVSNYKYLGTDDVLNDYYNRGIRNVVICVGYIGKGNVRQRIFKELVSIGFSFPIIIDPSAIISDNVQIGEGSFIGKGVIINSETKIGKMTIINSGAIVEHECIIDDYSHIAVGTVLCGQVHVGKGTLIGANATIIQCQRVDDHTIIPAGETYRG